MSSFNDFRFSESVERSALEDCSFWSSWFSLLVAFANFSARLECRLESVCWDSLCVCSDASISVLFFSSPVNCFLRVSRMVFLLSVSVEALTRSVLAWAISLSILKSSSLPLFTVVSSKLLLSSEIFDLSWVIVSRSLLVASRFLDSSFRVFRIIPFFDSRSRILPDSIVASCCLTSFCNKLCRRRSFRSLSRASILALTSSTFPAATLRFVSASRSSFNDCDFFASKIPIPIRSSSIRRLSSGESSARRVIACCAIILNPVT